MILVALLSNAVGLSTGKGFSHNQVIFAVSGVSLIVLAALGRRAPSAYRAFGLILLNLLALLLIIEMASIALFKVAEARFLPEERRLNRAESRGTSGPAQPEGRFAPYVMWRGNPEAFGDSCSIDLNGYRNVPGAPEEEADFVIFLMGGSAMWGSGVSDRETIGAQLQHLLNRNSERSVRVMVLAQQAFVSTQNLVELMLQLQGGTIPDLVVFYDGFNDIWSACRAGYPGALFGEEGIRSRFENPGSGISVGDALKRLLMETSFWQVSRLAGKDRCAVPEHRGFRGDPSNCDSIALSIVELYGRNLEMASALGERYGFTVISAWQPSIWYGEKDHSPHEMEILEARMSLPEDDCFYTVHETAHEYFRSLLADGLYTRSFADVLGDSGQELYTDFSGVHLNGTGNAIVAESLFVWITIVVPEVLAFTEAPGP